MRKRLTHPALPGILAYRTATTHRKHTMTTRRQPPRYALPDSITVLIEDRAFFVFPSGTVVQEVSGKGGKRVLRRVTSHRIAAQALSLASTGAINL